MVKSGGSIPILSLEMLSAKQPEALQLQGFCCFMQKTVKKRVSIIEWRYGN